MTRTGTLLWTVGIWLVAATTLIAGHVLLVFVYSLAVAPGLTNADYQEFARASGPWFSIVVGIPVFYAIGRFLRRRIGEYARSTGLKGWGLYSVADLTIVLASGASVTGLLAVQWVVSQAVKLWAMLFATRPEAAISGDGGITG